MLDRVPARHSSAQARNRHADFSLPGTKRIISRPQQLDVGMAFVPGQRWISTAEPELGLGTVMRLEGRTVQVVFATSGVIRQYALTSAPLLRAEFKSGDSVSGTGKTFIIERMELRNGIAYYHGAGMTLAEGELDDVQNVSKADERLVSGRVDRVEQFELRVEALQQRAAAQRSPAYGLACVRVDLIPHQLRVAEIAAARRPPRILLADEVGLGKTIEAGLILARLLASGRVGRVLVLLPESLVFQWFVELLRRFNLAFAIFDEERCEAIEMATPGINPFEDDQLVIASIGFLADAPKRAQQVLDAGWDLLVVDEAHHLAWSPEHSSTEYDLVEKLAQKTPGVILLTATPEQLGRTGHFARLRLLDPARYHDLGQFQHESDGYAQLSQLAEKLQESIALDTSEQSDLAQRLDNDPVLLAHLKSYDKGDRSGVATLLDALIDRHGTGRVMFRNRRAQVGGFPQRVPHLSVLDGTELDDDQRQHLLAEFSSDMQQPPSPLELNYAADARLPWLLNLIETSGTDKLLLICRSQAKVLALEEALRTRSGVKVARFHEGMSIIPRDRNAAFFAQPDGARLLLCAEIGSEGRNFQFAHTLILWDLPLDPDMLEQRIGRLDRIGQKHPIAIHGIAFSGSAQQVLLRWFDQGLDAFRTSPADGRELLTRFQLSLLALATQHARGAEDSDAELDVLTAETRAAHEELAAVIHRGRDRLLELAATREAHAETLRLALLAGDQNATLDAFVLRLFEQFGIENDEHGERIYLLDPEYLSTDGFPGLQDGPQQITFDRATALSREELPLLRFDHPMVIGALELLLDGENGNCAFLADDVLAPKTVLLECIFVLDCLAAKSLHIERFLPPTPLRAIVDTKLQSRSDYRASPSSLQRAPDRDIEVSRYRKYLSTLVPPMRKRAEELALIEAKTVIANALQAAELELGGEIARLTALKRVNPSVRQQEIDALQSELTALRNALPQAHTRLDAVRFVCSADFLGLR